MEINLQIHFDWWKIMKVTFSQLLIILTLTGLSYARPGKAQSVLNQVVNLSVDNSSLESTLKKLMKDFDIKFVYSKNVIRTDYKVSLTAVNEKLGTVLDKLLWPNGISYEVVNERIILSRSKMVIEQPVQADIVPNEKAVVTVKGKVTDEQGPLPGVSIKLKGTSIGTTTDIKGNYSLNLTDGNGTLIFASVGFTTQEIAINGRTNIDVQLKAEATALNEIVVVGYGSQKKVNLVGSVASIKVDEKMTSRALSNVSSGLSGLVPGLAATQSTGMAGKNGAALIIRGLGTVNNSSPLVVVDGMPDVDINRININDIETVSVLKDATSSSVYGSRAANGVILITTKSGKGMKKTSINFSSNTAIEVPTKGFDFLSDYSRALTLEQRLASTNTALVNQRYKNGTIDQWMALSMIDPLRYPNTDWWSIIMRNGALQTYNLSESSGNENSNIFVSLGLKKEKGLQINNDYTQYNARFNYDYALRSNMNTGIKFNGNWSNFVYALSDGFTDPSSTNTAGLDMRFAIAGITPFDPASGHYGGVMAYGEDPQAYNPYTVYVNNLNRQERQEANTSMYIDWTPVKGLTGTVEYALNYYNQFGWNADIPNQAFNFQTNTYGSRVYVGPNAPIVNNTNTGYKTLLNGRLKYQTTIGKNHEVAALFVYSEEYWHDRFQGSSRNDRLYPTLHEIDAALTDIQTTGGNSSSEGLKSYIGRVNYTAYNKYLFEGNFRVDGSSRFAPGQQFGLFPSAAVGWRFTEEELFKPFLSKFLTSGKFRASYGSLGNNSGVGRYEQQTTLNTNNYIIGGTVTQGFTNNKLVNQALSWEVTTVLNLGLDLSFLNSKLTTEFDYYDRLTTGMNRPSDLSNLLSGAYSAPRTNIGNLRNRGFEGNIAWRDKAGSVNYGFNLNASFNSSTLEKWNEYIGRGATLSGNSIFLNMPYGYVYAYEATGIAQTWADVYNATPQGAQPGDILRKDLNGDGRIDANDIKALPNVQQKTPTTFFGLNSYVSWKGIDLSFLWQGSTGRKDFWLNSFNTVNFSSSRYAVTQAHWDNPWSLENRDGQWPRLGGSSANTANTTFWLDDMSYLRLKNIQVGYTFPKKLIKRLGIANLRITGSAENLLTITSYRGLDPEKAGDNDNLYPLNKAYSLSVQLGF
jgi:TonB-linked SusC/RagA family outer membrane protein